MNIATLPVQTYRQHFWQHFWSEVRDLRYAYLKYFFANGATLPDGSDVDLLIDREDLPVWLDRLEAVPEVLHLRARQTGHACYVRLFFADGSHLELDLIHRIQRNGVIFLRIEEVLVAAQLNQHGIKVPIPAHDFAYLTLFYMLNDQPVPAKYRAHFELLNRADQEETQQYIEETYSWPLPAPQELFETDIEDVQQLVEPTLHSWPENGGWDALMRIWRSRKDSFLHRAPVITFSGVDGAGKTTTLDAFQQILEGKYRFRVKRLRQRPGLLPILSALRHGRKAAEQKAATTLPRQGTNKNSISSLIRFAWYYLDYQIGQWLVYWRYTRRGVVVLYDRYYFDYIADSRRANIALNRGFIQKLYRWVFKPDLNIMLYADPDVILARKQELDAETITELTTRYRATFAALQDKYPAQKYICINNLHLTETLQQLEKLLISAVSGS